MGKFMRDTIIHKKDVADIGKVFIDELDRRIQHHDDSKLSGDEQRLFERILDNEDSVAYGTPEYEKLKAKLKPALIFHYNDNSHHPEHFIDGINGMNLIDLIEMYIDWCSAANRHKGDNIHKSINLNAQKYDLPDALVNIFHNTADDLFL